MTQAASSANGPHEGDTAHSIGRRQAARLRLSIPARLVTLSDTRHCILIDLSRTGAQIGLEEPLEEGENAFLQIDGLDEFAEVVRSDIGPLGGINGVVFEEPLSDEQVISVRRFSESLETRERQAFRSEVRAWVTGCELK
ncbi:PilZ domain-containing protein [uncultured Erythrobacter sp.]|uniref:PilZ domain-containing protein n=1 Tax=uncultured Erythrobacter sp. TaxID=263913 RepID=UPI00262E5509|nr:PilZ domain-containing protein [uncultured Erythrobacter sp.]